MQPAATVTTSARVAGEREGRVGEREDDAAVARSVPVEHVRRARSSGGARSPAEPPRAPSRAPARRGRGHTWPRRRLRRSPRRRHTRSTSSSSGLRFAPRAPLLGRAGGRVARLRRVAEREHDRRVLALLQAQERGDRVRRRACRWGRSRRPGPRRPAACSGRSGRRRSATGPLPLRRSATTSWAPRMFPGLEHEIGEPLARLRALDDDEAPRLDCSARSRPGGRRRGCAARPRPGSASPRSPEPRGARRWRARSPSSGV